MSPWWVAIGFAAWLAVAAVVGLVVGQAMLRRLQALLPPDPATGENPSEPARAAVARVVFRNLQHLSGSAKSDLPGVCPREV
jgi:hypothetical protein